jgi:hypothetical protein
MFVRERSEDLRGAPLRVGVQVGFPESEDAPTAGSDVRVLTAIECNTTPDAGLGARALPVVPVVTVELDDQARLFDGRVGGELAIEDLLRLVLDSERDEYCDRVDTLTAVAKGNKRHVQEMFLELQTARAALEQIRHLHKDSPMGPCPVCIDADAVAAGGDGLVPYPCPTGRLAGAQDCNPPSRAAVSVGGEDTRNNR